MPAAPSQEQKTLIHPFISDDCDQIWHWQLLTTIPSWWTSQLKDLKGLRLWESNQWLVVPNLLQPGPLLILSPRQFVPGLSRKKENYSCTCCSLIDPSEVGWYKSVSPIKPDKFFQKKISENFLVSENFFWMSSSASCWYKKWINDWLRRKTEKYLLILLFFIATN